MLSHLATVARYARGLPGFLRHPVVESDWYRGLRRQLEARERVFLDVLEQGVFALSRSPYRRLLEHCGVELGDVAQLVEQDGIEAALQRLHGAGVRVTLDEFKGNTPIERPGLSLPVRAGDFDSPLMSAVLEAPTGGSRSSPRRIVFDFQHLSHDVLYDGLFLTAFGVLDRPRALWQPILPGRAGLKQALRSAKLDRPIQAWFSQNGVAPRAGNVAGLGLLSYTIAASRACGHPLPVPHHVPPAGAATVARWLGNRVREGCPGVLSTVTSSAVRVCLAAQDQGIDIAGSTFHVASEPYTPAKAQAIADAGCRGISNYAMTELGRVGIACADPWALDDVHLVSDKLAVIQRERDINGTGTRVASLLFTTLHPSCPKLMLNVESDDYARLARRTCNCPIGELGFSQHLSGIRSHEKLTSDGMNFMGGELITLLEQILPSRFGGQATDYQLAEEEIGGLPQVRLVVSPRLGDLDHDAVAAAVLEELATGPAQNRMMSDIWRGGSTLTVVRREPYATGAAKILPLHILERS